MSTRFSRRQKIRPIANTSACWGVSRTWRPAPRKRPATFGQNCWPCRSKIKKLLADKNLQPYRLLIERLIRYKKHTLGKHEEELLAMQGEMAQAARRAFRQLHDADLKFGFVTNEKGEKIELSNATYSQFLISPKRSVRRTAFQQYYQQFAAHENTLAATLSGSILKDVYYARAGTIPCPGCGLVPRQCSAIGLRQPDPGRSLICRPCITTWMSGAARCG